MRWSNDCLLNKWYWNNWTSTCKNINPVTQFTHFTKINSKWIKDLNIKQKTTEFIDRYLGENLDDLRYVSDFSDTTPKVQSVKERTDMLNFIKIKNFAR